MTLDELIAALQKLSADGHGSSHVWSRDGQVRGVQLDNGELPDEGVLLVSDDG